MNTSQFKRFAIYMMLSTFLGACSSLGPPSDTLDLLVTQAKPVVITKTNTDLSSLPEPVGKITVAVYAFTDQTGQFKPSPSNSLSTAVSQGADTILIKALLDSGWFIPVERAGLNNLLTERKITQQNQLDSNKNAVPTLPEVSPANVIIEGSIIGYDFNIRTGGAGAKFLGVGASQTYREDQITINLRMVNIQNGIIINSVSTTKRIFSRQLNSGIFNYVDVDKILELEGGYSYNEPGQLAVTEAIESGLISLIADGILAETWQLADFESLGESVFSRYLDSANIDQFIQQKKDLIARQKEQEEREAERQRLLARAAERLKRARATLKKPNKKVTNSRGVGRNRSSTNQASSNKRAGVLFLVGAHTDIAKSTKRFNKIDELIDEVKVQHVTSEDGNIHSVHIGPISDNETANSVIAKLRTLGVEKVTTLRSAN